MSVIRECLEKSRIDDVVTKIDLFLERNVNKMFTEHYDQLLDARNQLLYFLEQDILRDKNGVFHFGTCSNLIGSQNSDKKVLCICCAIEICELSATGLMDSYSKLLERMERKNLTIV